MASSPGRPPLPPHRAIEDWCRALGATKHILGRAMQLAQWAPSEPPMAALAVAWDEAAATRARDEMGNQARPRAEALAAMVGPPLTADALAAAINRLSVAVAGRVGEGRDAGHTAYDEPPAAPAVNRRLLLQLYIRSNLANRFSAATLRAAMSALLAGGPPANEAERLIGARYRLRPKRVPRDPLEVVEY